MNDIVIAPSVLTADFCRMGEEIDSLAAAGADMLHLDVMDGEFVPNISFGPKMVEDIDRRTVLPLDAHLMIVKPERYLERFAAAGADYITVHYEATSDPAACLKAIRVLGKKSGIAISPDTPASAVVGLMPLCDLVLVMSVYPGFGGQKFIPTALGKLEELNAERVRRGLDLRLEVDGGVGADNIAAVKRAGADTIVAGSAVCSAPDRKAAIERLKRA